MKSSRRTKVVVAFVASLLVVFLAGILLYPSSPHLICHRALNGALQEWMHETRTNAYPNIEGNSLVSLSAVDRHYGPNGRIELRDYVYVPGLKADDPADLVLFYVREKSRRRSHTDPATIFRKEQKWIVISPRFNEANGGELNDWVDLETLKARLKKTGEFLKVNQRPFSQKIANELDRSVESLRD